VIRPENGLDDIGRRIRDRFTSPPVVVDACLERIDALNPRLNAFITVLHERARGRAREASDEIAAGRWRGPLHGVPVGVKDFYDTAGVRTTAAFEHFKQRVPRTTAAAVERLEAAGVIVIGKTNMHRLGTGTTGLESDFGPVRNPVNEAYIPGGSSSGSAAAVAAGLCFATLDTDAIGSCRLPAACCGVVGFKGTYGLVTTKGILEGEKADEVILWFAHAAITARSAEDVSIMLGALAEKTPGPAPTGPLRVGVAKNFEADTDVRSAFNAAVDRFRALGYDLVTARAPFDMPRFGDLQTIRQDREAIAGRAFGDIDVLVLPTTTTAVPAVAAAVNPQFLSPANTAFANYFGLPAISVPCGVDPRGLPIGLQIVGRPGEDATVLDVARRFEKDYTPAS
jgi:aspartyl-tRNA(Asn)/glutamyl-tRNA(Gln) amidotransferase subunit A